MNNLAEEQLEELLRREFAGAVADDGFSARVMRALPRRTRQIAWLLPAVALSGGLLAWLALLPSPLLQGAAREWLAGEAGANLVVLWTVLFGVGLLSCAWAIDESP
jgi:uncharacterized membrane protein (DUF485 family)